MIRCAALLERGYGPAIAILLLFVAVDARSDTPQPRFKLGPWAGDLKIGPGMSAAHRNLRGSEFVGQDLSGAVFDGSDLFGVHFWDCNLSRASFKGADLTEGFFDECASLQGADFTDATITSLVADFSLSPEQLQSTRSYKTKNLRGCLAISAIDPEKRGGSVAYDFRGANLEGARLSYGDFRTSDFTGARIDQIELYACRMNFSQLASTKNFKDGALRYMRFSVTLDEDPDFTGIDLTGTQLGVGRDRHARLTGATIMECTIGPMLTREELYRTKSYQEGNLRGVQFRQIDMSGWDFSRQNLTGCAFSGCHLAGARFDDAVITAVTISPGFRERVELTMDQIKSTWNYKHGRMKGIVLPDEIRDALESGSDE